MMRSVSLVNRLELEFPGTLLQHALCLGDVDNDNANELAACNTNGDLAIYKGRTTKPWRKCTGLGFATVVAIDDIQNIGKNSVIVLNGEGLCYTFHCSSGDNKVADEKNYKHPQDKGKAKSPHASFSPGQFMPRYKQQMPPNCKAAIITDIDGDGKKELIAAYTDRVVRIFRWEGKEESEVSHSESVDSQASAKNQKNKLVKQGSKDEERKLQGPVKQSSKDSAKDLNISGTESDGTDSATENGDPFTRSQDGNLVMIRKIGILAQIGSLAVCATGESCHQLIASQPGGGYIVLETFGKNGVNNDRDSAKVEKPANSLKALDSYPVRYLLSGVRARSQVGNTEVVGLIQRQGRLSGRLGFCTSDGIFGVLDFLSPGPAIVSMTTDHKWFTMDKLDVTMDGNEEIVLCSWDGMTYVLNQEQDILSYNFGENVCAFKAGMYSLNSKTNVPCLSYATFSNRIMLYYDIQVDSMEGKSLYNEIIEQLTNDERYASVLDSLTDGDGNVDLGKLRELIGH